MNTEPIDAYWKQMCQNMARNSYCRISASSVYLLFDVFIGNPNQKHQLNQIVNSRGDTLTLSNNNIPAIRKACDNFHSRLNKMYPLDNSILLKSFNIDGTTYFYSIKYLNFVFYESNRIKLSVRYDQQFSKVSKESNAWKLFDEFNRNFSFFIVGEFVMDDEEIFIEEMHINSLNYRINSNGDVVNII